MVTMPSMGSRGVLWNVHPGSGRPWPLAVQECAIFWSGGHPAWASDKGSRALPLGLYESLKGQD
jgi:hypothetical protein